LPEDVSPSSTDENPLAEDLDHILARTEGLWEPLRGENVFVTGGTGFFGHWILESFAHANQRLKLKARMVVLSRNPESFTPKAPHLAGDPAIEFVRGDVRTFTAAQVGSQLRKAPERYRFIIHAATEASAKLNAENPLLMLATIVEGTRAALDFSIASGANRFLLTSSGAVYGRQPSNLTHIPEDYPGGPAGAETESAYGEGKRRAELLCASFYKEHGLEPLLARCFAFVGPFLPLEAHFAIGNFIRDALRGGPIQVNGDGTPYRSYLYAADLAIWLWTILLRGKADRPYNVGSRHDLTIAQLAETVRNAIDPGVTVIVSKKADPTAPVRRYVPATNRAETELNLRENINLEEAIKRTASFVRNNRLK
jgi:nucleoside-diphosphate-sugar epimerase